MGTKTLTSWLTNSIGTGYRSITSWPALVMIASVLAVPAVASAQDSTPRDSHWQLFGIDESRLAAFGNDVGLNESESEALYRILFRIPQVPPEVMESLIRIDYQSMASAAGRGPIPGDLVRLRGRVTRVETQELIPELVERFQFRTFFHLTVQGDAPAGGWYSVYAREIPRVWLRPQALDEPCQLEGMFLKSSHVGEHRTALLAADRVRWHPEKVDPGLNVTEDLVKLGKLGVDVGLLENVQDRQRLSASDREIFYTLLVASEKFDFVFDRFTPQIRVAELLTRAQQFRGTFGLIQGTARRIIRIEVSEPELQNRFGLDHYYEMEVFVPTKQPIKFVDAPEDSNGKVFTSYPVTVCVTTLPANLAVGADVREAVSVSGVFLKLWAYHTEFMSSTDGEGRAVASAARRQIGPLFIGSTPRKMDISKGSAVWSWALGCMFVLALAAIWRFVLRSENQRTRYPLSTQDARAENLQHLRRLESDAKGETDPSGPT